MICKRETCEHTKKVHAEKGCRVTGCGCPAFVGDDPTTPGPRRICIDVPDGYTVSVSLIPWKEEVGDEQSSTA